MYYSIATLHDELLFIVFIACSYDLRGSFAPSELQLLDAFLQSAAVFTTSKVHVGISRLEMKIPMSIYVDSRLKAAPLIYGPIRKSHTCSYLTFRSPLSRYTLNSVIFRR